MKSTTDILLWLLACASALLPPAAVAAAQLFDGLRLVAVAVFCLAGPIGLVALLQAGARHHHLPRNQANLRVGLALLGPLLVTMWSLWLWRKPPLFDVTTDLMSPPEFLHTPWEFDEQTAPEVKYFYPALQTLLVDGPVEARFRQLQTLISEHPEWVPITEDQAQWSLECRSQRGIFALAHHLVLRLRPAGSLVAIDMRSRGELPLPDGGGNAAILQDWLGVLKREMPGPPLRISP